MHQEKTIDSTCSFLKWLGAPQDKYITVFFPIQFHHAVERHLCQQLESEA